MNNAEFETIEAELIMVKAEISQKVPPGYYNVVDGHTKHDDLIWSIVCNEWKAINSEIHWSMEVWKFYGVARKLENPRDEDVGSKMRAYPRQVKRK